MRRRGRISTELAAGGTPGARRAPACAAAVVALATLVACDASRLEERSLVSAASLIFHELIPGHHFQVALQLENESLHPYRQNAYSGAFTEGWAEYAASLGPELGLFDDPYDRYGQLITQIFLAWQVRAARAAPATESGR